MLPAAILSIIFGVLQIAVPEVDAIAARRSDQNRCYTLLFSHDKSVAWMSPAQDCRRMPPGVVLARRMK